MNAYNVLEKLLLEEFNLSDNETNLYLFFLKNGAASVLEAAEGTGINRTTVHINVDTLSRKGLITEIKKGGGARRLIMAEPIEKLSIIFKERKAKLEAAENQLNDIAQEIARLKKESIENISSIDIRRYEGKAEVKLLYDEVLKAKEIRTYANTADLLKIFPGNIHKFVDAHRKNSEMCLWEIMEDSEETQSYIKQMNPKRFFYRLGIKKLGLPSIDYLIFDGKVAMIEVSNGMVNGLFIENARFYESSRAIHQYIWKCLERDQAQAAASS